MSGTLLEELREYGDHLKTALSQLEVEDVVTPYEAPALLGVPGQPRRKRGWAVAVGVALAFILVVGGVALIARQGTDNPPVVTEPPPATTTTTSTTTLPVSPTTVPVPTAVSQWSRIDIVGDVPRQGFLSDVTLGGPGLVAVGNECGADCTTISAVVWVSVDGVTWERPEVDPAVFEEGTLLTAVTGGGPGLVAVGLEQTQEGGSAAAIWVSEDGFNWSQAPAIEEFAEISRVPLGVAASGSRLVAVGSGSDEQGIFGRIWISDDGLAWTLALELPDVELINVTAGGPGFLALGSVVNQDGFPVVAVWASEDGISWIQVLQDDEVFAGQLGAVEAGESGAIVLGGMPETAWVSPDGLTWTRVVDLTLTPETRAAVSYEGGFIVAGRGAWWSSEDGLEWVQFDDELFADSGVGAVTAGGSGLVAVGAQAGQIPTVWLWSPQP